MTDLPIAYREEPHTRLRRAAGSQPPWLHSPAATRLAADPTLRAPANAGLTRFINSNGADVIECDACGERSDYSKARLKIFLTGHRKLDCQARRTRSAIDAMARERHPDYDSISLVTGHTPEHCRQVIEHNVDLAFPAVNLFTADWANPDVRSCDETTA
jgi:hypothetical protein